MGKENTQTLEQKVESFIDSFEEKLKNERTTNSTLTDTKIEALKSEVKKQMDDYLAAARKNNVSLPGTEKGTKEFDQFNFAKAAYAIINDDFSQAGFEKEVFDQTKKKAVDTNTGSQGGFLIPTELANDRLIMPALAQTVLNDLGITRWNGLTDDLAIPEATSRPTLVFGADGQAQAAQNVSFKLNYMRPRHGGMLCQVSNKLLKQAAVAGQIVESLMQEGISDGVDKVGIIGTGTDYEPLGIFNTPGLNTAIAIGAAGGRLKVDKVASMISDVEVQNYLKTGNGGLLCHPRVKAGLKRERVAQFSGDTSGEPLINPLMTDAILESTVGLKVRSTTNVPSNIVKSSSSTLSKAVVGEWAKFALGTWGGATLKRSDVAGTAFATDQTWLVIFVDLDFLCLTPLAFSLLADCETLESKWA
jgi:HK97 family phage major capsid protein